MRILQLIDSLRPGGAEQMAVAYANALSRRGCKSYLCCTRMEGLLKKRLEPEVGYLFLEKMHTLDLKAFLKVRNYVRKERIELIQAHSSSIFLAVLVKLAVPGIKLVWHDHYGKELKERKIGGLKWMSRYFDGIISVNEDLINWTLANLNCSTVIFIKNFLAQPSFDRHRMTLERDMVLRGNHKNKIICVANLRPQKDHFNLIKAFERVMEKYPDVSLHLVGKDEKNDYSQRLKSYILEHNFQDNIFFYGELEDAEELIKQATIGVLASSSEGLPVVLLEYGLIGLPIVCTDVGEIKNVVKGNGFLVPPKNSILLAEGLKKTMIGGRIIQAQSKAFQENIIQNYSEAAIIPKVISFFEMVTNK